jgi:uncharacterized repeat protein (TIGR01451 family)
MLRRLITAITLAMAACALTLLAVTSALPSAYAKPAGAQSLSTPYTQNFNSLTNTGTTNPWENDTTLAGWYAARATAAITTYRADDGTSNTGALYSYGSASSSDRALGSICSTYCGSSGVGTLAYGLRLQNDTGAVVAGFVITYTGEQWRNGGNATQQKLTFGYQVGTIVTDVIAGSWITATALDFTSPIATATAGALDGNAITNSVRLSATVNVIIQPGEEIMFRWLDLNDSGNDHGLAIDDLSVTAIEAQPEADLAIGKSGPSTAAADETITYTIDFSNTGDLVATATVVTDTLPAEVTYVTYTASIPVAFTQAGNTLVWDVGDVATGTANSTIQVQATIANYVAGGTVFTNSVTAATTANETALVNNTATAATRIIEPALGITKAASPDTNVEYHGQITYTVALNNNGELDAANVLFTDTLPAEVDFARWVDQPAGANEAADEVTWNGTVQASQTLTFTFVVTHVGNYSDIVTNTAEYAHTSSSGSAKATFTVMSANPDLSITKSATPNTNVAYHSEVTYTVMLNNAGAVDAVGAVLTDTLPLSTTFARWVNQPVGATATSSEINWTGVVSSSQAVDFTFVVSQTGDYGQTILNTAQYDHPSRSGSADAAFTVEPLYPVTFVYHDAEDVVQDGEDVYLAGSFNGWNTTALSLTADGGYTTFTTTLNLPAGPYDYKYIVKSGGDQSDWLNTVDRSRTVSGTATFHDYRNVVVDSASLNGPAAQTIALGSPTALINGQVYVQNVTNPAGAGRGLEAEVGYGTNVNPANWSWFAAPYLSDTGNNDVYGAVITPTAGGVFSYATRFNGNWGVGNPNSTWTYGDLNGIPFSLDEAGVLTVTLPNIPIIINELDSDQPSTDTAEFIELYDGGVGNTALNGLTLVLFNGNGNVVYSPTFDLDGYATNANGYFVIGGLNVSPTADIIVNGSSWLQNGPDGAALYVGNATDFPVGTTVTSTNLSNLVDAIVYSTDGSTAPGLQVLLNSGQPQVNEGGRGSSTINSLQRCPNGSGGARNTNTYYQNTPTPKSSNLCPASYDAAIFKTGPSSIQPGANVTYTIVYSSVGLSTLTSVVITDLLPSDLTYITDTSGLPLVNTNPLVWQVGSLTSTLHSFQLVAAVSSSASGYLTNTASIASAEADGTPGNNTSSYSAPVASFDLEVTKSVSPTELFIETGVSLPLTYTIQINNRSLISATTRVTVTDVLPIGFVYAADDSGVTHSGIGTVGNPLTWVITNPINPNSSVMFHVMVTATDTITGSGLYRNQVSIASEPIDPISSNNTAQDAGVMVWKLISIAEARTLPLSSTVYVGGYVNYPPGLSNTPTQTNDEFLMQDASLGTTGVSVFYTGSIAKFNKFAVGDYVRARGTLAEYNGKLEVVVFTTTHAVSTGLNIPLVPWVRATGQISEATEGVLVQTQGTVVSNPGTGLHLYINDGSGQADIFRDQDTPNLSFAGYQAGDVVRVLGVGTQSDFTAPYDSFYEVIVRYQSDVVAYPAVTSVAPANNATDVAVTANISATFNVTMTNVGNATFTLHGPSGAVAGAVTYDDATRTASFDPTSDLANSTRYTATLSADLAASNGMTLTQDYVWSFTTVAALPDLSTSTKVNSVNAAVFSGDWVTYTIQLNNTGNLNATAHVTDVLSPYYTVAQLLDFAQPTAGTLSWTGVVTAGQSVTLRFVAQVKSVQNLPRGAALLFNTAEVNDGYQATFTIEDPAPPTITIYGINLPFIRH